MKCNYKHFFVPQENLYELEYVPGINIYPLKTFSQIVEYFIHNKPFFLIDQPKNIKELYNHNPSYDIDFQDIKGHLLAKRALSIAAAGLHNLLMV